MSLGDKLRQRRQEMGLTRPQLAAKICVTPSAIANYENGISTPKPDILISLINVLEVDANYMYSDYLGNSQIIKIYDHSLSSEEVDAIKKYDMDLVVCGHHQDFWSKLMSSARQLINTVHVDMLIVPLRDDEEA